MRKFDETTLKIAERVFEKSESILEQRRKRAAEIRRISFAVSGLCAAVIVCVGAWRFASSKSPRDSFTNPDLIYEAETTTVSTEAVTTAVSVTNTTVTSTMITSASSSKTSAVSSTSVTESRTTATNTTVSTAVNVRTSVQPATTATETASTARTFSTGTALVTTIDEGAFTGNVTDMTTTTFTGVFTDWDQTTVTTTDLRKDFRESTATIVMKKNGGYVEYEKENTLIEPERIGDYISDYTVSFTVPGSGDFAVSMKVYEIKDTDREEAVAVRLMKGYIYTDDYYLFRDPAYKKEDYSGG